MPPVLALVLVKELEELRAYRTEREPALNKELDDMRAYCTQTEPRLADITGQLQRPSARGAPRRHVFLSAYKTPPLLP